MQVFGRARADRERRRALDDWFRQRGGDLRVPEPYVGSPADDALDVLCCHGEELRAVQQRTACWHDLAIVSMRLAPFVLLGRPGTLADGVGAQPPMRTLRRKAFDVVMIEFWPRLPPLLAVLRPTPEAYAVSFDTRWWIGTQLPPGCSPDHRIVENTPSGLDETNVWFPYARDIFTPAVQEQMAYDRGPVRAVFVADGWLAAHCGNELDPHGMEIALGFLESIALAIDDNAVLRYQQDRVNPLGLIEREMDEDFSAGPDGR